MFGGSARFLKVQAALIAVVFSAGLLSAAYAGQKTVRLNTTPNPAGPAFAAEIEVGDEGVPPKK